MGERRPDLSEALPFAGPFQSGDPSEVLIRRPVSHALVFLGGYRDALTTCTNEQMIE